MKSMFGFFSESKPNSENKSNFVSYFICFVMCVYLSLGFRKSFSDPIIFSIQRSNYTWEYCKRYVYYLDVNADLSDSAVVQFYHDDIIRYAVFKAVITNLCDKIGIVVDYADVMDSVINDYAFMVNGKFSRDKFLEHLKKRHVSENDFYLLREEELKHKQFWFLVNNSFEVNEKLQKLFNESCGAKRYLKYAKIDHKNIHLHYTENDLKKFYDENKEKFRLPRKYKYKGVVFSRVELTHEDAKLLQRMMDNKNFNGLVKTYKKNVLNDDRVTEKLGDYRYNYDRGVYNVGDCLYCGISDSEFMIMQVESFVESEILPFDVVKDNVIKLYESTMKPIIAAKQKVTNWKSVFVKFSDGKFMELPDKVVVENLFRLKKGECRTFYVEDKDATYFIKFEEIVKNVISEELSLKQFIEDELQRALLKYLLSKVRLSRDF